MLSQHHRSRLKEETGGGKKLRVLTKRKFLANFQSPTFPMLHHVGNGRVYSGDPILRGAQ